jgi:hypothetical protein
VRDHAGWLGRSSDGHAAALYHLLNHLALIRIQAAELILDIDPGLAAHVEQVFALHV